jgi:hypothetical protein
MMQSDFLCFEELCYCFAKLRMTGMSGAFGEQYPGIFVAEITNSYFV